jgi:UDP-glucose 4-epimerase
MRVFVTGAAGFLGSAIARILASAGHDVTAAIRPSRLNEGLMIPGCQMKAWDALEDSGAIPQSDAVVHCATSNDIVSRNFEAGVDLTVKGTYKLLQQAKAAGVTKFIFLSTIQVHGTELEGPINEDSPVLCETPYALNHFLGEETCRLFSRTWPEAEITLLRPSNVYGVPELPSVNRSSLVPMCFVVQAHEEKCITLRSSGRQIRNFVSTKEVAQACQNLLNKKTSPGVRPVLAVSAWHASIIDIANITARMHQEILGSPLRVSVLANTPETGNIFEAHSKFLQPTADAAESALNMQTVIRTLFSQLSEKKQTQTKHPK